MKIGFFAQSNIFHIRIDICVCRKKFEFNSISNIFFVNFQSSNLMLECKFEFDIYKTI